MLLIAFLFSVGIYSQNVTGIVTSDDGPLPGATLLVKGTNNFATTDFDGNFTIEASQGDVLVVSFVGYTTQKVTVNADQLTISLALGNLKIEKKVPFISSAEESGFYVYGDVKDLKTITLQNGKKVILVAQNGANLKVFEKTN